MKPIPLLLTLCTLLLLAGCTPPPIIEKSDAPAPSTSVPNVPTKPQPTAPSESTPAPDTPDTAAQTVDPSLSALQAKITETGSVCGIAFLGYLPDANPDHLSALLESSGYLAKYPFLAGISGNQLITYEGDEVYCLVPQKQALSVQTWICNEENGYQGKAGDTLYSSDTGAPIIFIGNLSDIIPNLLLTLTENGTEVMSYNPSLSMCDGTVALPVSPAMYDFSIYPSTTS